MITGRKNVLDLISTEYKPNYFKLFRGNYSPANAVMLFNNLELDNENLTTAYAKIEKYINMLEPGTYTLHLKDTQAFNKGYSTLYFQIPINEGVMGGFAQNSPSAPTIDVEAERKKIREEVQAEFDRKQEMALMKAEIQELKAGGVIGALFQQLQPHMGSIISQIMGNRNPQYQPAMGNIIHQPVAQITMTEEEQTAEQTKIENGVQTLINIYNTLKVEGKLPAPKENRTFGDFIQALSDNAANNPGGFVMLINMV